MAANFSVHNNTTIPNTATISPQETALQSLCKQLLKSRLFRGFYEERRYVENVQGYRDIVSLHKSEKDLNKLIKDIRDKLQMFYVHQNPNIWIGVTCGPLVGSNPKPSAFDTYIWAEIDDLAFGQYWFSIKTLKFRDNEVILRLKTVRSVDAEEVSEKWSKNSAAPKKQKSFTADKEESHSQPPPEFNEKNTETDSSNSTSSKDQVNLKDFADILQFWWTSIKQTTYDFLTTDISKDNIKGLLRFLGLLVVSILSGAFMGVKFLGNFTIRFMFEFSRLTHVLTPIIFKIIDLFTKLVGGFYILLAMIWKDTVGNRLQAKYAALEYNRPMYKSIQYDVQQSRPPQKPSPVFRRRISLIKEEQMKL